MGAPETISGLQAWVPTRAQGSVVRCLQCIVCHVAWLLTCVPTGEACLQSDAGSVLCFMFNCVLTIVFHVVLLNHLA